MLIHKRIEHAVVDLVPGTHAALLRMRGFRGGTVPALNFDGRRVQGSRAIARVLDEVEPEPPLFPTDPGARSRVEEAERWGDQVLQPVPRRIAGWVTVHGRALRVRLAREAGMPAASLVGAAGWPVAWYFARKVGATDTDAVRRTVSALPELFDHAERLLEAGTIGGDSCNAADYQIGTALRLLMTFADLAPLLADRRAARFATELMPGYPTGMPAGSIPSAWLEPLRAASGQT